MKKISNFSLKQTNSFGVESISPIVYFPSTIDDLIELSALELTSFYILGEGFNTLLVESQSPTIIKPDFNGIKIEEQEDCFIVKAAASENWHKLVEFCIDQGINGLENLALIPGSVGAAPVQNIGAYGVELAQYCKTVQWFDFQTKSIMEYQHKDCEFGYRESIFKRELKNKGLITGITLCFPKNWTPNLSYAGLNQLPAAASAKEVMKEVITIRQSKLPDPYQLANAGSFFKNPVIENSQWQTLISQYPNMPSYPQSDGKIKIAAGWLIEHTGLKGYKKDGVGVHEKQALVIVNYQAEKGEAIASLALYIRREVNKKFNILLEHEVRAVFSKGEQNLTEYKNG